MKGTFPLEPGQAATMFDHGSNAGITKKKVVNNKIIRQ